MNYYKPASADKKLRLENGGRFPLDGLPIDADRRWYRRMIDDGDLIKADPPSDKKSAKPKKPEPDQKKVEPKNESRIGKDDK